ncbi:hypothetical protein, partial [Pseudomonas gelidaquae]|uniref:hypothetical protein n=1 Tax=Pseudomonas sp. IB20 TaxID=1702250 RepID=UPI001C44AD3D
GNGGKLELRRVFAHEKPQELDECPTSGAHFNQRQLTQVLPQGISFVGQVSVRRAIAAHADLLSNTAPMWELSSPSEAAKAAALSAQLLPDPPLSQPR